MPELVEYRRVEIGARGINDGAASRRSKIDIGAAKRKIEENESDKVRLLIRLGRPKGRERRMAPVDRFGKGDL